MLGFIFKPSFIDQNYLYILLMKFSAIRRFSKFTDLAQQGIISNQILKQIRISERNHYLVDLRSLRQKILDRKRFKQQLLKTLNSANSLEKKEFDMNWLDQQFSQKNYDQVFKCFEISSGAPYNQVIFPQNRMFSTHINGFIALFPVPSNTIYYRCINHCENGIISGNKGTGKSFAIFSIIYFNQFMVKFITSHFKKTNFVQRFLQKIVPQAIKPYFMDYSSSFVQKYLWKTVPYICCISIKDEMNHHFYFRQIMIQFTHLYSIQQIKQDFKIFPKEKRQMTQQQLIKLLITIKQRAQKYKNITTLCFIDEANKIFRLFRKLKLWVLQNKNQPNFIKQELWKNTTFFKDLTFYHELLIIFMNKQNDTSFNNVIFNSSQNFQLQLFQDSEIPPQVKDSLRLLRFFKDQRLFEIKKTNVNNIQINNKMIDTFELYQILWFQIIKNIQRRELIQHKINITYEQKLKQHKQCFNNAFRIINSQDISDSQILNMVEWQSQITHLDIRQFFTSEKNSQISFFSCINNIFNFENPTTQQKKQFSKDLLLLKQQIQKNKINSISKDMIKYIQKGLNYHQNFQRTTYLNTILQQAVKLCQKSSNGQNGISLENYKNEIYLEQVKSNDDKIKLVQTIKIGFVENGVLRFNMNPKDLVSAISLILHSHHFYEQVASNIVNLVVDPATTTFNKDVGKILDRLSYPIFKDGNLKLQYIQRTIYQEKDIIIQPQIIEIKKTCFIQSISGQQYKKGIFDIVIQTANQTVGDEYTAGYPMTCKEQGLKIPSQNNMTFDCMIAKKITNQNDGTKDKYQLLFYDWSFGKPGTKERKQFIQKIMKYLKMANIKADIYCKLLLVCPKFYVENYVNWYENTYLLEHKKLHSNSKNNFKLFLKQSHSHKIQQENFVWNIQVGIASFDQNPFFFPNNPTITTNIIIQTIQKCYNQVQIKYHRQNNNSSQKKN